MYLCLTGRGSPWCNCSLWRRCRADSRQQTRWWRSVLHRNNLWTDTVTWECLQSRLVVSIFTDPWNTMSCISLESTSTVLTHKKHSSFRLHIYFHPLQLNSFCYCTLRYKWPCCDDIMFLYVKCVMSYTTEFSVKGLFKLELLLVKTKAKTIYKIN